MTSKQFDFSCEELAVLLSHPQNDYLTTLERSINTPANRSSNKSLRAFRDAISGLTVTELQELYSQTFDLNPMCSPALSVHLFGVESFKRSHLMVGLLDMYRAVEFQTTGESADHMSTVVRFIPFASREDRAEIVQYILVPGLTKMAEFLESKANPFASLIRATISIVSVETNKEVAHA